MSKSFDGAIALGQAIMADCDKPILGILQKAHEHDMELADKSAYNRGYEDGKKSMDADHRAVAMRLQALRFDDGGSHGRLSEIAHAVYPEYRHGWTQGACAELRDELIRLMGGVHDDPVSVATSGDACGNDCHRRDGETGRVTYDEPKSCKGGETIKSGGECDGKIMENGENHQIEATITDELRECVRTADRQYDDMPWYEMSEDSEADHTICLVTEGELLRIADRIDEQFRRICEQHEAVLQSTISDLIDERDELQKRLERSRAEYCETCEEAKTTDILRAKLDAVREALDGQR